MNKKVLCITDLSCYGRGSLYSSIPIFVSNGIQCVPLPTALLSAHTEFEGHTFLDLTNEMEKILAHFEKLNLEFDAIYTGFFANIRQIDIAKEAIKKFKKADTVVLVDPIMGDDGKTYPHIDDDIIDGIKNLVELADCITPNTTELKILGDIGKINCKNIIVTGIRDNKKIKTLLHNSDGEKHFSTKYIDCQYSGMGDAFASFFLSYLLQSNQKCDIICAVCNAVNEVYLLAKQTYKKNKENPKNGLDIENFL